MATFQYNSRFMRQALWAECLKDFEAVKAKVQKDAEEMLSKEIRGVIARYGIRMMEAENMAEMRTDVAVTIIEPESTKGDTDA